MNRRLLVVEDHALVAIGLQLALSSRGWEVETTSGPTVDDVVAHAHRTMPSCVLLDIHLGPLGSGIDLIRPLVASGAQVVMMTSERRRMVLAECVEAGATGWIPKTAVLEDVDAALRCVLVGGAVLGRNDRVALLDELRRQRALASREHAPLDGLTQREILVLGALVDGLTAEEIARAHFVSLATVRTQIRGVLQKLGVRSQLAAVAVASAHRELLPEHAAARRERRRTHPRDRCDGAGPERRR